GINFKLGARFAGVEHTDSGVKVSLEGGQTLEAELLLVAVGRGPSSANLGYEEAGVTMDRGFVIVDEYCRTSVEGVYAVGDLIPTLQLAHVGFAEGILVAEHIAGLPVVPIDYAGVPRITYSSPEVASVGLTEAQAAEKFGADNIKTVNYDLSGNGRSAILNTKGAVKLIAEKSDGSGRVLGVHIVGDRVGELIAEAQLIYNWEALPSEVAQLIHPHPTQSEAIGEAHLLLAGKPLHVHD
ncbi:MAG: FAD-dependent oxidoreductase, partial [Actinobacteria bacterium]|nr:FAD-dependent oxidoreductase [Actinomycetota bacterium]